jgi:hypothetical protein
MEGNMSITNANINRANNTPGSSTNLSISTIPQTPGQALFQQAVQSNNREAVVKGRFEQSISQQTELADEFVEAAGQKGINTLAKTPDGQYALRTIYDHASSDSREFMRDVHGEQGNTAVDYTYSEKGQFRAVPSYPNGMAASQKRGAVDENVRIPSTSTNPKKENLSAFDVIGEELSKWIDDTGNSVKRDFSGLSENIAQSQTAHNEFYQGMKDNAVAGGNLPKYLLASFGQSAGNLGHYIAGFSSNLVGDQDKAAQQLTDFKEYSLETSEGTNAIELELSTAVNVFGTQLGLSLAFGVDNQGRVDFAVGGNYEPNTDVMGVEGVVGVNVAKAWQVESVNTLISGYSTALEGFVSGQLVVGGELSYGQGDLHTEDGDIAFSQMGAAITIEDPIESPVLAGVSADIEYAKSVSYYITGEKNGVDLGWFGQAIYGLANLAYGNSMDDITTHKGKK